VLLIFHSTWLLCVSLCVSNHVLLHVTGQNFVKPSGTKFVQGVSIRLFHSTGVPGKFFYPENSKVEENSPTFTGCFF
jgi:hypothetical protein